MPNDNHSEEGDEFPDLGDSINHEIHGQMAEMFDDPDFKVSLLGGYFKQVRDAFTVLDKALSERDWVLLGQTSHNLKGSSSTMGLQKTSDYFAAIEDCTKKFKTDPSKEKELSEKAATHLAEGKKEYQKVEPALMKYYQISEEDIAQAKG